MRRRGNFREMDRLRLVALGRIPRCGGCPRYKVMRTAVRSGVNVHGCLPVAPAGCTHEVCAPIALRYGLDARRDSDLPTASGQG
jgi:hypothetical protein